MKKVELDVIVNSSHGGEYNVFDKEDYNDEGMYLGDKIIARSSSEVITNVCVKENFYIFYDNGYNIFSRFDTLKQKHNRAIKIIEIKENSIIVVHQDYQQFLSINGKEIKDHDKPFEIKVGETLLMYTNMYDADISYAIRVNKIINK